MSRKESEKAKWIKKCEKLIREQKFKLFGRKCQFCGRSTSLGLFHILSKATHPRLRLHEDNMLISCWFPCHHNFHHDPFFARDVIFPKIAKLCGDNWEECLLEIEKTQPKMNLARIKEIYEELKERDL